MKFSNSKDNIVRANLSVKFRIGIDTFVDAALRSDDEIAPKNRKEWEKVIKTQLRSNGIDLWALTEEATDEKRADYKRRCLLLFPELREPLK
jgi:hypothetical protein